MMVEMEMEMEMEIEVVMMMEMGLFEPLTQTAEGRCYFSYLSRLW